jgi:hypothetical protein
MSSHLYTYLLDLPKIRALVGSGDEQLLEVIRQHFGDRMATADEQFDYLIEAGAPTAYEALRAVINGGPFGHHAFQYRLAYQRLCELTGFDLSANVFSHFRGDWLDEVDKGLASLNVTAISLFYFTLPQVPVPVEQSPEVGYGEWSPDQIAQALHQFRTSVSDGTARQGDPEVTAAVAECLSWMHVAESKPGLGIAGFFHVG